LIVLCRQQFKLGSLFSGLIDDVQIYNEALTPDEIVERVQ